MKEFNYTITDPEGIHARPAGELVKAATKYVIIQCLRCAGIVTVPAHCFRMGELL